MIVAFIGVSGSGKDYRKELLLGDGYFGVDFKDELLDMASDLVGFDVRRNYDYFKENIVGLTVHDPRPYAPCMNYPAHTVTAEILAQYPKALTGRVLLQRLGTEVMRKRDERYWTKAWKEKAKGILEMGHNVAVADCRFGNEVAEIVSLAEELDVPYKLVFCDYHSKRYNPNMLHESEAMAQGLLKMGYKDGQEIGEPGVLYKMEAEAYGR